jgi:DedD protein
MAPPASKDIWWLQIAALSDAGKADQIRAKLVMLNLRASTQKIESKGQPLFRIRVGPYKSEDDAFGDLDILTENDFHARLLKDPVNTK